MRIVAFNGSPRGAAGNTHVMVENFLSGAEAAGAETESIILADKKIGHCRGCFACWLKTPGKCIIFAIEGFMKEYCERILGASAEYWQEFPVMQKMQPEHLRNTTYPVTVGNRAEKLLLKENCQMQ